MNRKDLSLSVVIGAAVGLLVQPMISTLGDTLSGAGIEPTALFRTALFIFFLFLAPFALFVAYLLSKIVRVVYQFAKFAAVGTLNTMIDFGVLNLLIAVTGIASGIGFSIFKAISFLVGTTNSFAWNKFWTFESKEKTNVGEAAKFYTIAITGWVINVLVASLVVNGFSRPETLSENLWANVGALAGVGASFLWNFLGYKFVVFKQQEESEVDQEKFSETEREGS